MEFKGFNLCRNDTRERNKKRFTCAKTAQQMRFACVKTAQPKKNQEVSNGHG